MEYVTIIDPSSPCTAYDSLQKALDFGYPLDLFQKHAVCAIEKTENVLCCAKTGSGKSNIAIYQIAHSLQKGQRVFYTTPIKSLSNQKFYDLKRMFPDRVGIMTGDIKFKPDADIVIMTTEILRNLLYKKGTATESIGITASLSLDRLGAVVFDECHYINDRDRGAIWEETLILLDPSINLILLSATIDTPEQFASWLGNLKKVPINLISTQYRIVPLVHGIYKDDELLTVMDNKEQFNSTVYNSWLKWLDSEAVIGQAHKAQVAQRRLGGYTTAPVKSKSSIKAFPHQINSLIARLEAKELLPALFFVFSRKDCERYAGLVEHTLISSSDVASVKHIIDFHLHRYEELQHLTQYHTLRALLEKGIAFHHSGLLPILKEIVEILFGKGFIKVLFATETFAVGINMPTKTVVFTGFRKYDDATEGMRPLNTDEYIQMAGRAGRRGMDDKGLVLYLPASDPEDLETIKRIMVGKKSTFQSRMSFYYDFLLKTLQTDFLDWKDLLYKSYWYRRHLQITDQCKTELEKVRTAVEKFAITPVEIQEMVEFDRITDLIKQSTNAARRQAQVQLEKWQQVRIGPKWFALQKERWPQYKKMIADVKGLERDLEGLASPERASEPTIQLLTELGFLADGTMTPLGRMGSEINEGHAILEPLFYDGGNTLKHMKTAEEILTFLACFLGEGAPSSAPVESLNIPRTVIASILEVKRLALKCRTLEDSLHVQVPMGSGNYWEIGLQWVEPISRWLQGATLTEIIADYGIFEGNFIRAVSKLTNLLEEWKTLATLSADTEMLTRMSEAVLSLPVAANESLYLRL